MLTFCIVKKTGSILLLLMGLTVGREAGRQASRQNTSEFRNYKNSLQVKLFGLLYFIYYHCSVATAFELHFNQLLSSKAYNMCFEVQKIQ